MADTYGKALKDIKDKSEAQEEVAPEFGDKVFKKMHEDAKDPKNYNAEALKQMKIKKESTDY